MSEPSLVCLLPAISSKEAMGRCALKKPPDTTTPKSFAPLLMAIKKVRTDLVCLLVAVGLQDEKGLLDFIIPLCLVLHVLAFASQIFAGEFIH